MPALLALLLACGSLVTRPAYDSVVGPDSAAALVDSAPGDTGALGDSDYTALDTAALDTAPEDTAFEDGQGAGDTDPCEGLLVCEDFEADTAGAAPDPAAWSVVSPSCSGDGRVFVDDSQAHSGARSLRIEGSGGYCNHVFAETTASVSTLTPVLYGRFWVRFEFALGMEHVTFATFRDQVQDKDLRLGGQSEILMWNRESDDATLPELSPTGIGLSTGPLPETWTCISFAIDQPAGTMETWVDGQPVEGLRLDGVPTQDVDSQWLNQSDWAPQLVDAKFGWESYGSAPAALWFDDLALADAPLSCD